MQCNVCMCTACMCTVCMCTACMCTASMYLYVYVYNCIYYIQFDVIYIMIFHVCIWKSGIIIPNRTGQLKILETSHQSEEKRKGYYPSCGSWRTASAGTIVPHNFHAHHSLVFMVQSMAVNHHLPCESRRLVPDAGVVPFWWVQQLKLSQEYMFSLIWCWI